MNKIGTLFAAGLITLGISTKAAKTVIDTTAKHSPKTMSMVGNIKPTEIVSVAKYDTLVKPKVSEICDEVRKFRAGLKPDSVMAGDTLTLLSSKNGVKIYTDPIFKTETYVVQDGLRTVFNTCPEKTVSAKEFKADTASQHKTTPKALPKKVKGEYPASYPVEQEYLVEKGKPIWAVAKELSTINGKKPSKELTLKVTKQILKMNNLTMQQAKNLKPNTVIKLPTGKSIVKK